jgi:Leucine-rich repeat (LRR) protein
MFILSQLTNKTHLMLRRTITLITCLIFIGISSCTKEEYKPVLQTSYDPIIKESKFEGEDFVVSLNARALQPNERGQWAIISGAVADGFVFFDDANSPFSKFKGLPGEEYTLEWKRSGAGTIDVAVQTKIKIPELVIEIKVDSSTFPTIRSLYVDSKYKGIWSFDKPYGHIASHYHDGYAEPPENKPSIELHGNANTQYTATYKYSYANKVYEFKKVISTGNHTQEEALHELQISKSDYRVVADNSGNVIEINFQSAREAIIFNDVARHPALTALTKLRKLNLNYSSLTAIPSLFGDYYQELEELSMLRSVTDPQIPENFGNLVNLKILRLSPRYAVFGSNEFTLPKSFANLKSLESLFFDDVGSLNFNGTLGGLTALQRLEGPVAGLPENIGNLKNLQYVDVKSLTSAFPERISECQSLAYIRIVYDDKATDEVVLPAKFGDLKKLQEFYITTHKLRQLPASFSQLSSLKALTISGTGLQSIPEDFGSLSTLTTLTLHGSFTSLPESFGKLSKLSHLFLGGKASTLPESFGDLSALKYFNGDHSGLKTLPESFGRLKNLTEINLQYSKIESLPASFAELDALEVLNLSNTQLKAFPKSIIPLKRVTYVLLYSTNAGNIPDDIAKMKSGVKFEFMGVKNLSFERLQHILIISKGKIYNTDYGFFSS